MRRMSLTAVIGGLAHMVLNGPTVPYVFNTVWAAYPRRNDVSTVRVFEPAGHDRRTRAAVCDCRFADGGYADAGRIRTWTFAR
jgi:hypothetical protein